MIKMKTKIVAIFALVLISLALVGAAYAVAWLSQTSVTINGTLTTGNIDVEIVSPWASWDWAGGGSVSTPDVHTVKVTASGLYPGASFDVFVPVQNMGTLPVTLTASVSAVTPSDVLGSPADVTVSPNPWTGSLAVGVTQTLEFTFAMNPRSSLPSSETYTLTITITATYP
jgi:hypothetical protein